MCQQKLCLAVWSYVLVSLVHHVAGVLLREALRLSLVNLTETSFRKNVTLLGDMFARVNVDRVGNLVANHYAQE